MQNFDPKYAFFMHFIWPKYALKKVKYAKNLPNMHFFEGREPTFIAFLLTNIFQFFWK